MMQFFIILAFSFLTISNAEEINHKELKCLVCRSTIEEMEIIIKHTGTKKTIDIGKRLDDVGNMIQKEVLLVKSETFLTDQLETICNKLDDYVRARYRSNGQLTIFNMLSDGKMNPDMSKVDIIQDGDLNRSLKYICGIIVEEYDEEFIKVFQGDKNDKVNEFCTYETKVCEDPLPSIDDDHHKTEL